MNRILKAYDRNIVFNICEKAYHFSLPIILPNGDEIHFNCQVEKNNTKALTYTTVEVPKVITLLQVDYNCHSDTFHSWRRSVPS